MPAMFPLLPTDNAIRCYETVRWTLIRQISADLRRSWNAVSVFNFGRSAGTSRPAVVIVVQPYSQADWRILEHKLLSILGSSANIAVEFIPGQVCDAGGRNLGETLQASPVLGASIGRAGESGGGTLGGFVTLEGDGVLKHGFLTNHHVVKPSGPPELVRELDQHGFRGNHDGTVALIQYLAMADLSVTWEHFDQHVLLFKKRKRKSSMNE